MVELGDLEAAREQLAGVELIAASDVEYPLLGPWGAAGCSRRRRARTRRLSPRSKCASRRGRSNWKRRPRTGRQRRAGAGAAGGIGAALFALGARCKSGAAIIAEQTIWPNLAVAELIVTGEGQFDEQSLHGKVVGSLAQTRPVPWGFRW